MPARVGATATVDGVAFEVTQVMGGRVEVTSDQRLATEGETGGSDLTDLRDVFLVSVGEDTELDTPTLDGGVSYTLTLSSWTSAEASHPRRDRERVEGQRLLVVGDRAPHDGYDAPVALGQRGPRPGGQRGRAGRGRGTPPRGRPGRRSGRCSRPW